MAAKSQENNVMITCEHRQAATQRDMKIIIRYEEWERRIKCGEKDDEKSPYTRNEKALQVLGCYNPVDCEACKSKLSEFLKSVLHPNPDEVLQDLYENVSSVRRMVVAEKKKYGFSKVYEIVNHVERHNLSHNKEWVITWVDYRKQQQEPHPLPVRAMEPVKVKDVSTEGEGFTCAICLEGVKGKKRKRSTSIQDDVQETEANDENRVVRLLSCQHMFHKTCIDRWLKDCGHDTCPLCRILLPKSSRCWFNWDLAKKKALDNAKVVKLCYK